MIEDELGSFLLNIRNPICCILVLLNFVCIHIPLRFLVQGGNLLNVSSLRRKLILGKCDGELRIMKSLPVKHWKMLVIHVGGTYASLEMYSRGKLAKL